MVSISKQRERPSLSAVFQQLGLRSLALLALVVGSTILAISRLSHDYSASTTSSQAIPMIRGSSKTALTTKVNDNTLQCRFFLAESAIPNSGLGIFTAIDIPKGELSQSMPDICIYVADTPDGTAFESHSWGRDVFMGSFEGRHPRAACEGVATLVNTMPAPVQTSELVPMKIHTNAGLHRAKQPGAGAISHYYGTSSKAVRNVLAGSEITIDYGDWEFKKGRKYKAPIRTPAWLQNHGMCIDNIEIKPATDPGMGRGAFARRAMAKGTMVAPAPLQYFPSRKVFQGTEEEGHSEALFVNYCFQPAGLDMLLYPYGPGVGLVNHSRNPNVALRWSTSPQHHGQWLDLSLDQFEEFNYPGALILELVALRDIAQGEELLLDYGEDWDAAWRLHTKFWKPVEGALGYVYPAEMDLTKPFRTLGEQGKDPYAANLVTACFKQNWDRENDSRLEWTPREHWQTGLRYCHILKREKDGQGAYLYEVSLGWSSTKPHELDDTRYINFNVPQSAIMFVDKQYESDMHLQNAFRHPMRLPDYLTPSQWKDSA